jgi:urease accessory protein
LARGRLSKWRRPTLNNLNSTPRDGDITPARHWPASLALTFRRDGDATILAARGHTGPLSVQKALYPEGRGVCHMVILHAPGGVAGGDDLTVDIRVGPSALALLTTPAATKWYKADGLEARQLNRMSVEAGGILEFLPQETILFDQAMARMETNVELAEDAVFAAWEITCFGRRASGESFSEGRLRQATRVRRGARLLWDERLAFEAGDRIMRSAIGLGGRHVSGVMIVAGVAPPPDLLEACRQLSPVDGSCGITALPDILVARYLGGSAEHAKSYFESLRGVMRPWYASMRARRPRIWDT